jgi:outer membrane protein OmpA-like peptidoglycan-associated protein/opacity protein-like surface antigen
MKKLNKLLLISVILVISNNTFAQLAENSWSFGFGGTYPRFMSVWSKAYSGTENYGGFLSLQRNFTENVALRLLVNYNYMEAIYSFPIDEPTESVTLGSASLDLLYYPAPCSPVSPYVGAGLGGIYFKPKNAFEAALNKSALEYQANLRAGAEWKISGDWKLITEAGYFTPSTNKLDGENDTHEHKGLFGTNCDTYINFNFGFLYYFSKGNPSKKCDLYSGVTVGSSPTSQLTLSDVEKIVKDNLPKEIIKEVVVEKPATTMEKRWVLIGVNFEFNSANLTKESFSILLNALQVLTEHPEMQVEIQGHSDNIGSNDYNLILSEKRAKVVRDYLVANGINADRLEAKGIGESDPVADNNTIEGRTLNRRIEFKVKK